MSRVDSSDRPADGNASEAALFEAISHDTRIRILFMLRDHGLGFSELKNQLGIKSSGNLQHHLGKLGTLINLSEEGLYSLTEHGKEAIMAIGAVRRTQNRQKTDRIIIALIYAFSFYVGFMNVPFLLGTVNAQTPLLALWMGGFMGIFMYLVWPWNYKRHLKKAIPEFSDKDEKDGISEASFFESIAHETRINALFILQSGPLGFSELKKKVSLISSGNLQHHINKLGTLIEQNDIGQYTLTDNGREAVLAIQAIRSIQGRIKFIINAMILLYFLITYVVGLTLPFLTGTVNSSTPLHALINSVLLGGMFYVLWSAAYRIIINKKAESSIWIHQEGDVHETKEDQSH
jgi:DNA-binding HxlR family transcriptional regulator